MKFIWVFLIALNLAACQATPVHFGQGDLAPEIQSQIGDFPASGSADQIHDEAELRSAQNSRTAADCARANSEVIVSLRNFYGTPYGFLNDEQIKILEPFFDLIHTQYGHYIGDTKRRFHRLRPYDYLKDLNPCVPKEPSLSYPSGHATLAALDGYILEDLFPDRVAELEKRLQTIAQDRVIAGVHHPTDIEAGKKLGKILYDNLRKSNVYQSNVKSYREKLGLPVIH